MSYNHGYGDDIREALLLRTLFGVGDILFKRLIDHLDSAANVLSAGATALTEIKGVSAAMAKRIVAVSDSPKASGLLMRAHRLGLRIHTYGHKDYPQSLSELPDPPSLVFVRGQLPETGLPSVAIVGTRVPDVYGLLSANRFATELVSHGMTIISGGARGIDKAAHQSALKAGGRTVAVLGCGHDWPYPAAHKGLFEKIAQQGAVVSEFPPGTPPLSGHFPRRNRIIAAMAGCVLVIQAGPRSGAVNTAEHARELSRSVFALPGPVDRLQSVGTNRLLKEGAFLADSPMDLISRLECYKRPLPDTMHLRPLHKQLLEILVDGPASLDQILIKVRAGVSEAAAAMAELEIFGYIKVEGVLYSKND